MTFVPYVAAIISSISFGIASVLEQKATQQVDSLASLNFKNMLALGKNWFYLVGLLLDGFGYVSFVIAVRTLPLFFVQSVGTASILITALAARLWLGARMSARDYSYIGLVLCGLVLLALATGPESSVTISATTTHILIIGATATAGFAAVSAKFISNHTNPLAILSGLCFSFVAILSRILHISSQWYHLLYNPLVLLIILNGILGLSLFSIALQHGSVTIIYSTTFVMETIIPTVIGLSLLGDTPLHHRWSVLVIGLIITIIGSSALTTGKEYLRHG